MRARDDRIRAEYAAVPERAYRLVAYAQVLVGRDEQQTVAEKAFIADFDILRTGNPSRKRLDDRSTSEPPKSVETSLNRTEQRFDGCDHAFTSFALNSTRAVLTWTARRAFSAASAARTSNRVNTPTT